MKKGLINVCMMFFGISLILVLTFTYLIYFQVETLTSSIKEEIYYTLMNGKIELEKEELSYGEFNIDKIGLEQRLKKWTNDMKQSMLNVEKIEIEELLTNITEDKATLKIRLKVTFVPLIKIRESLSFKIEDKIDLMLLKYK